MPGASRWSGAASAEAGECGACNKASAPSVKWRVPSRPNRSRLMPGSLCRAALLAAFVFALAGPARAQDVPAPPAPGPVEEITFEEALGIALRQNTTLRQAENVAEARESAVSEARAIFLPDLRASVRPTQRYGLVFDQTTGNLNQETSESLDATLSTSLNLFNGFGDVASLRRARLSSEASEQGLERARQDVLFTVASDFLQTILDQEIVRIQQENLEAERAQAERVRQLVEGGVRPRADEFQQAALVAERELLLLEAEGALELSKTRLVQTLQLDPFGNYTFVAPSLEAASLEAEAHDLEVLLTAALERRADLRAQELQIEAAEEGVRVARSGYYPSVNLFANLGSSYSSLATQPIPGTSISVPVRTESGEAILVGGEPFEFSTSPQFAQTPFSDQFFSDNRAGAIGLSVDIPVFDRFATRARVEQARLEAENERIRLDDLRQEVALQVRQGYLDYQNAVKRLDVTARQLAAAEVALQAEQERYDLGVSTLTELAQARARMAEAQSARAQAVARFVFQSKLIDYALGTLDLTADLF